MMKLFYINIALALAFSGCGTLPKAVMSTTNNVSDPDIKVCVVSHGWHSGIIIAAKDLNELMPALSRRFENAKYYEIGWGDSGFYLASKFTIQIVVRAVFWPSKSVVHVVAFDEEPSQYFSLSELEEFQVAESDYFNLLSFIKSSLLRSDTEETSSLGRGIYGNSEFFKGTGRYHLFNTCNKWTAKGLVSAGKDIDSTFKLTAKSIMRYLRKTKTLPAEALQDDFSMRPKSGKTI